MPMGAACLRAHSGSSRFIVSSSQSSLDERRFGRFELLGSAALVSAGGVEPSGALVSAWVFHRIRTCIYLP